MSGIGYGHPRRATSGKGHFPVWTWPWFWLILVPVGALWLFALVASILVNVVRLALHMLIDPAS